MAGENLARLMRDRAVALVRRAARDRYHDGDPEGADFLRDVAKEIADLSIGGELND